MEQEVIKFCAAFAMRCCIMRDKALEPLLRDVMRSIEAGDFDGAVTRADAVHAAAENEQSRDAAASLGAIVNLGRSYKKSGFFGNSKIVSAFLAAADAAREVGI